ncbi:hypothetical protein MELE44368_14330 [Mycolicibacterium elephantis DSM 44368]|uniref:Uncharacterized protein n=1 Tax=Mycolicibacterium elephantis DSM 44368 TaxID=1335622 RepID=A0A439DX08_9MYCO|nr:hypothetical protein MELE44368_14330 [Mycolicibacterium elephantis DSM 44368]
MVAAKSVGQSFHQAIKDVVDENLFIAVRGALLVTSGRNGAAEATGGVHTLDVL